MNIEEDLHEVREESRVIRSLLGKRVADWSELELQRYVNADKLRRRLDALETMQQQLITTRRVLLQTSQPPDNAKPPADLDPANYKIKFPFFYQSKEEPYLTLQDRERILRQINDAISREIRQKYEPIVISTSRGMGKTFLLKMLALQKFPTGLQCPLIQEAGTCGRILSFDFSKLTGDRTAQRMQRFFTTLMVWYLSRIFSGCQVSGIFFQKFSFDSVETFQGGHASFQVWKEACLLLDTDDMITEYIRLTNIAFKVDCSIPPVFLLDEIQYLCTPTTEVCGDHYHSLLSFLLTRLAGEYNPVCICTGTNNGKLLQISEQSQFVPQIFSLTPLQTGFMQNWAEMTLYMNLIKQSAVGFDQDDELIKSLVYASYKIPRLLAIAHKVWFRNRLENAEKRKVHYLFEFENAASIYYREMKDIWTTFDPSDIAHIILATGCRWHVPDPYVVVPGTTIVWNSLIQKSLIFPYQEGYYLFPYGLVCSDSHYPREQRRRIKESRDKVEAVCRSLIPNLEIKHLFLTYSDISVSNAHAIRTERLLSARLVAKNYIRRTLESRRIDALYVSIGSLK